MISLTNFVHLGALFPAFSTNSYWRKGSIPAKSHGVKVRPVNPRRSGGAGTGWGAGGFSPAMLETACREEASSATVASQLCVAGLDKNTHTKAPPQTVIAAVQLPSHVRFFVTPWPAAHQASLSLPTSRSLLKFMSVELGCHPVISFSAALFSFCLQFFHKLEVLKLLYFIIIFN